MQITITLKSLFQNFAWINFREQMILHVFAKKEKIRKIAKFNILFLLCNQKCEIGDASKGSLSSYAYILLLLYYLQQCSPPVIPVLQEMYSGDKPERIVEGWNTWFYQNIREVVSLNSLEGIPNSRYVTSLQILNFEACIDFALDRWCIPPRQKDLCSVTIGI